MTGDNEKIPTDRPSKTPLGRESRLKNTSRHQFDSVQLYLRDIESNALLTAEEELYYGRLVKKNDDSARLC